MISWVQYRLVRSVDGRRSDPLGENYEFIRAKILPVLWRHNASRSLVLNYFNAGKRDEILVRVEAAEEDHQGLRQSLESVVASGECVRVEPEPWSPQTDARNRVQDALANLRVSGTYDPWILPGFAVGIPRDLSWWRANGFWCKEGDEERMASDFATILTMVGDWSKQFIQTFERRPVEGYPISLLVHLLLNGLCYSGPNDGQEAAIRLTPLV